VSSALTAQPRATTGRVYEVNTRAEDQSS
jgi:hypothetical protein